MEFDLVIRDGLVIDGSGAAGVRGDVAVSGDRMVAVGDVDGHGREEIDAEGMVVAPGFIDAHTHMDAQVFWDDLGKPSCWQGCTSAVMGNCGFTLAPARGRFGASLSFETSSGPRTFLERLWPKEVPWTWESFGEFFDALEATPMGLNYLASIGHSALRTWAMGERALMTRRLKRTWRPWRCELGRPSPLERPASRPLAVPPMPLRTTVRWPLASLRGGNHLASRDRRTRDQRRLPARPRTPRIDLPRRTPTS